MVNRLAGADSAYLRQHADNPVDWYPWGDEAFDLAKQRDCPVFLSIGYAACHWCHVMAHESFEDPDVAEFLNTEYVCIKVDREERPDVDAVYMAATQAFTGSGGWPMSVFLTPERVPFYAGTYFPPVARHGQLSFGEVIRSIIVTWRARRLSVVSQSEELGAAVAQESDVFSRLTPAAPQRSWAALNAALVEDLVARADEFGGFSGPPRFPRPSYVEALLVRWHEDRPREVATTALNAMARGGLYDHIGGGFARYSVDRDWHVPHFEKMLSDQALLALGYLRAHRASGHREWRDVALGALTFVVEALAVPGGFASSLDADSGGREGAHITFTAEEVRDVLKVSGLSHVTDDALVRWRIAEVGEFEGRSIPRLGAGEPFLAPGELAHAQGALFTARQRRPQPSRDEKVVLEWNAMFACAALESGRSDLVEAARELLTNLAKSHCANGVWWRTGAKTSRATAADLAWLIEAHVCAFEESGSDVWLEAVTNLVDHLLTEYWDGDVPTADAPDVGGGVFTTARSVNDLPVRPKELFDGAAPSAHAVVASSLGRYGIITGDKRAVAVAERVVALAGPVVDEHPAAVPDLIRAYGFLDERRELVIPGPPAALRDLARDSFVPSSVLVTGSGTSPLLAERAAGHAYVCRREACGLPVSSPPDLAAQLAALVAGD